MLLLTCLVTVLPLKSAASAVDLLSDVDSVEYYQLDRIKALRASSYITSLPYDIWDANGSGAGTKIRNDTTEIQIGSYLIDKDSSPLTVARAAALLNINNAAYMDAAIQRIEDTMLTSADLTPIQALLNTYLPRIDMNTENLHGDLLNIQSALGWTTGTTVIGYLSLIQSDLVGVQNILSNFQLSLLSALSSGFSDVTSRQDIMYDFWSASDFVYYRVNSGSVLSETGTLKDYFGYLARGLYYGSYLTSGVNYLTANGTMQLASSGLWLPNMLRHGFLGLSVNVAGTDKSTTFSLLRPSSSGGLSVSQVTVTNLLDALGLIGTELQNPLAKLQYVWADDDDIRIADANKPVKGQIEDDFVGDGDAAVKVGDISDVASLSTGVADAFSGAGSASDVFILFGDSNTSWFFSQEVASDLDQVNSPVPVSESDVFERYLSDVDVGEDGYVHPKASPFWDVSLYLG